MPSIGNTTNVTQTAIVPFTTPTKRKNRNWEEKKEKKNKTQYSCGVAMTEDEHVLKQHNIEPTSNRPRLVAIQNLTEQKANEGQTTTETYRQPENVKRAMQTQQTMPPAYPSLPIVAIASFATVPFPTATFALLGSTPRQPIEAFSFRKQSATQVRKI